MKIYYSKNTHRSAKTEHLVWKVPRKLLLDGYNFVSSLVCVSIWEIGNLQGILKTFEVQSLDLERNLVLGGDLMETKSWFWMEHPCQMKEELVNVSESILKDVLI